MKKSLSKRILYNYMIVITIILVGVTLGLSFIIQDYFWGSRKRELIADGKQVVNTIKMMDMRDNKRVSAYLSSVDHFLRARILLFDENKKFICSSLPRANKEEREHNKSGGHGSKLRKELTEKVKKVQSLKTRFINTNEATERVVEEIFITGNIETVTVFHPYFDDYVMIIGLPIKNESEKVVGALLLNSPIKSSEKFLTTIFYYIAIVGVIAVILSWILTQLLSRRIVKPLITMRESAAAIAKGDYSQKIDVQGEDEVADLGRSLNSLAKDLESFIDKTQRMEQLRRDFVANVSHELRTPITIIRGYNEAMLDGTITQADKIERYRLLIRDETIRLENLIRELLDISRLQARVEKIEEPVPLDAIVKEIAEKLTVKAVEKEINIIVDVQQDSYICGIGNRLVQLVMILADNAVKYSNNGGQVTLSVKQGEDNKVHFVVEDQGVGIVEDDQDFVWERFYKVDKSHNKAAGGCGLGLSIAKEIIEIHKGEVFLTSELGVGTRIEVVFEKA